MATGSGRNAAKWSAGYCGNDRGRCRTSSPSRDERMDTLNEQTGRDHKSDVRWPGVVPRRLFGPGGWVAELESPRFATGRTKGELVRRGAERCKTYQWHEFVAIILRRRTIGHLWRNVARHDRKSKRSGSAHDGGRRARNPGHCGCGVARTAGGGSKLEGTSG